MDQTQPSQPLIQQYQDLADNEISDELFESPWNTPTLAMVLASEISVMADNPKRRQFLAEYHSEYRGGWVRGNICRALAAHGVTLADVNFRKS